MTDFPYAVTTLLFNRPDVTHEVLASLAEQDLPVDRSRLVLGIDGYAGSKDEALGRPDLTAEVADLAREAFPEAEVVEHPRNLGIARHYAWAEERAFARPGEWALFLEDDLVLSPAYTQAVADVIEVVEPDERVAVVSASGDTRADGRGEDTLYPMDHAWGFALRRGHHVERTPYVEAYLGAVADGSYFERDARRVRETMAGLSVVPIGTSQDSIKQAARLAAGRLAVTTGRAYGRYIGVDGEHFTEAVYDALGYDRDAAVATRRPALLEPLDDVLDAVEREERRMWADQMSGMIAVLEDAATERDDLAVRLAEAEGTLDAVRRDRDAIAERLEVASEQAFRSEVRAQAAEADASAVRRTASWRITAPLRRLGSLRRR